MGRTWRLMASYPREPAPLANIVNSALRDELPGVRHEWELVEFLSSRGFHQTTYAGTLPAFHRLMVDDDDVYGAISRLLNHVYSMEAFRTALGGASGAQFNLLVEPDRTLRIVSGPDVGLGSNFDLSKGTHSAYLQDLEITDASGNRATGGVEGKNVTVVVVDSGADASALANGVGDFRDIISNPPSKSAIDNLGHGTAMVEIVKSVAPQARICAVRIFDMNGPELSDAYAGIVGALSEFTPDVLSLSLGFPDLTSPCSICGSHASSRSTMLRYLFDSIEKLAATSGNPDPIFVAATGNDHPNIAIYYPAAYANGSILAVGSIKHKPKQRSQFSNFGKSGGGNFVVTPGGDWDYQTKSRVEWVGEGQDSKGNPTYCMGTSPAAAYAAGGMALYREQKRGRAPDVVDEAIAKCKTDLSPSHLRNEHGSGRLVFANVAQGSNADDAETGIKVDEDRVTITSASGRVWIPRNRL